VNSQARPRPVHFRGRSYLAFSLAPELPLASWLVDLDAAIRRSAGFFAGRPAVLDLGQAQLSPEEIAGLIQDLDARNIRIMGIEGVKPADLPPGLPPVLTSGRPASGGEMTQPPPEKAAAEKVPAGKAAAKAAKQSPPPGSLLVEHPVRSGQTIYHPHGDVIVLGSVGSGAEIVAGGSIHIYGALRGRAMAGANGNAKARIFCRKIEAELLAIGGYYRTTDDLEEQLRNRPIQAWLDGETMVIAALE
jgi:septum site-determining protein MinC